MSGMKPIKLFFVLMLLIVAGLSICNAQQKLESTNCEEINFSVETIPSSANQSKGEIKITCKDKLRGIKFIFCDEKGYPLNPSDLENGKLSGLSNAIYYCYLVDNKGCSKGIKIELG